MAIGDAVVLAKCLRDEPYIEDAFATYEHVRRDRVERVVAQGRKNGNGKTPGLFGRIARDLMLRLIFGYLRSKGDSPMGWIFEHHVTWGKTDLGLFGSSHLPERGACGRL